MANMSRPAETTSARWAGFLKISGQLTPLRAASRSDGYEVAYEVTCRTGSSCSPLQKYDGAAREKQPNTRSRERDTARFFIIRVTSRIILPYSSVDTHTTHTHNTIVNTYGVYSGTEKTSISGWSVRVCPNLRIVLHAQFRSTAKPKI